MSITVFLDHVSHDGMMKFLQVRIRDSSLLLLIRRFLKAGYVESGHWVGADEGTPQGGPLSPLLANIYLHYVLDLWFERCAMVRSCGTLETERQEKRRTQTGPKGHHHSTSTRPTCRCSARLNVFGEREVIV